MEIENKKSEILSFLNAGSLFNNEGGIYAWLSNDNGPSFLYSEISGYFLTLTSFLYSVGDLNEDDPAFKQAHKTCNWLLNSMLTENGSFIDRVTHNELGSRTFFFDDFMIIQGLLNYSSQIEDKELTEKTLVLLKKLSLFWRDDEDYNSLKNLKGENLDSQETWSTTVGPHHLKGVLPLLKAYHLTKDPFYKEEAYRLKDFILKNFLKDGLLESEAGSIHSHPLLYALEGMITFYNEFPEEDLKKLILVNFKSLSSKIIKGSIPRYKKEGEMNHSPRLDIYFQYLRVESLINHLDIAKLECKKKMIIENIEEYYNKDSYLFGADGLGKDINHRTSWINFMALQYYASLDKDKSLLLRYLV